MIILSSSISSLIVRLICLILPFWPELALFAVAKRIPPSFLTYRHRYEETLAAHWFAFQKIGNQLKKLY